MRMNFMITIRLQRMTSVILTAFVFLFCSTQLLAQDIDWSEDGNSYYVMKKGELIQITLPNKESKTIISQTQLTPKGYLHPLDVSFYAFSKDQQKVLIFTNTKRVWRLESKGDYWVLDLKTNNLAKLGGRLPESSLMFAKFSPDGKSVAYVSGNNIYMEDLVTKTVKQLTIDGTTTIINGTFDWAYEEEFACRDGFRWSPDSKSIAYWQLDASSIKKFYMINNTDSIYSQLIPLEYPKVGEKPSVCKVGVVNLTDAKTTWLNITGDPSQNYLVRMEFIPSTNKLLIQQLNRKQNHSKLYVCDNGTVKVLQEETDEAWIDIYQSDNPYTISFTNKFIWLPTTNSILWASEKDGWRHLYQISLDGKPEKLVTKGNFDFIDLKYTDPKGVYVYYIASPDNATQRYLYKTKLDGSGKPELVSPADLKGTHDYSISTNGAFAIHRFENHVTPTLTEFITLQNHKPINEKESIASKIASVQEQPTTEFFQVTTSENVVMDGWMVKPKNFDPKKKYPVVFYVYSEPAGATVSDQYGAGRNFLYAVDMRDDGYIYISLDNRGTPAPKGRAWRKAIYRKIGQINIQDQAMAAKEILKWNFVDTSRIAVWGWSGGGSATLNLLFQYPEIYKTGVAVAGISNQLTYDNIYQERYMGLPQENKEDFIKGSPMTHVPNFKGNLLYIHGTADDNVHYQNAEILINEMIKYNKQFQFMAYPNRTHSISEGEGTYEHLSTLYTNYLKMYCPPGGR